jgi:endo-1,4-beta-xylanase
MDEAGLLEGAAERVERHRKAEAVVRVVDGQGKPVPGARIAAEQTQHAFLFGCNIFPVLTYDDSEQEAAYERRFTALLNYATLGFYWGSYERTPGHTREEHLTRQARWCQEHGLATKGHPLVWHEVYPEWAPAEVEETREKLRARVTQIVSRFAGLVDRWDVVNEATVSDRFDNGVGHWAKRDGAAALVTEALQWAHAANPKATLLYNEYNLAPEFEALVADLITASAPVHVIGIQSHMHHGDWPLTRVWEACETYARFGKPLHFTETTVLSGEHGWMLPRPWPTTPEGEAHQADYVAKLYTLLFSHPAVEAITWWDLMDGAWQGAPAGLLRADLTPKPAYERLMELIRGEWWTRAEVSAGAEGEARFRGFAGRYRLTVTAAGRTAVSEIELARGAGGRFAVTV